MPIAQSRRYAPEAAQEEGMMDPDRKSGVASDLPPQSKAGPWGYLPSQGYLTVTALQPLVPLGISIFDPLHDPLQTVTSVTVWEGRTAVFERWDDDRYRIG